MAIDSIPARLFRTANSRPTAPAYFVKRGAEWVPTNWKDYAAEIRQVAKGLIALGFEHGHTVSILGFNRPEWVIFDVASMVAGGAPAGIYTTCSPSEVAYIIRHAESRFVLVENQNQYDKVKKERDAGNLPALEHIVFMRGATKPDDAMCLTWEELLAKGAATKDELIEERLGGLKEDQNATFIYTSGTTGPPKAVMLSHKNLTWTADCAKEITGISETDCCLSYLPLSHIAEQMFTVHGPVSFGVTVYFAESIDKVPDNLKEVQPTVLFAVPRIWEKFHAGVTAKLALATGLKAKIAGFARRTGKEVSALRMRGEEPGGLLALKYKLANKLVFSKVKPALGLGRARICVSGAAPIAQEVLEFFTELDVIVHEVYGQSEGTGPTSFNRPGRAKFGTVGPPIPGCEVKIAPDGEILVKGPNVFLGYYKEPEATAETLVDGYLCSGDLGELDKDGFLKITGRKKEIIITAGGKNIAPKNIEAALKHHPLVGEAVVIGDRRKFLSALITLEPDAAKKYAADHGITGPLHSDPKVLAEVQKAVDDCNKEFAQVEWVRKFTVLDGQFTIDGGELTPTLKIKRKVIASKYSDQIEAMYADAVAAA